MAAPSKKPLGQRLDPKRASARIAAGASKQAALVSLSFFKPPANLQQLALWSGSIRDALSALGIPAVEAGAGGLRLFGLSVRSYG